MTTIPRLSVALVVGASLLGAACESGDEGFARAFELTTMAQSIGGPAALARPGDYVLENDRIRAVVHGRHNERSTFPIANGSLVDLDLQRPHHKFGVGKGKDVFYELGPMVNLKINASTEMSFGACDEVGASPCPERSMSEGINAVDTRCARVSAKGKGDNVLGILGLLDMAIKRSYPARDLEIVTDYDLCPGESFVRLTTRARFYGATGEDLPMDELKTQTALFDLLLGEYAQIDCGSADQTCPADKPYCEDLLTPLKLGEFDTTMKRCRGDNDKGAGVFAGDLTLFSAKARVFIPGNGFDNQTSIRSVFDTGGDVFSSPLALDYMVATGKDVSYAYFNAGGKINVPIFAESFTVAFTHAASCPRSNPTCFDGKELVFRRFVSVGDGSVASALEPFYALRKIPTGQVNGHVIDARSRKPLSGAEVFVFSVPTSWANLTAAEIGRKSFRELEKTQREETRTALPPLGELGLISHFVTDSGLDTLADGSFSGPLPEGRYILMTRSESRPSSGLMALVVKAGATHGITLSASDFGVLEYSLRESSGRNIPAKLTLGACLPECARDADCAKYEDRPRCDAGRSICIAAGVQSASSCRPDQRWDETQQHCACPTDARLPLELGGRHWADGVSHQVLSDNGRGQAQLPPGTYEVLASRGMEYEVVRRFVTIRGGTVTRFEAHLPHVVDTRGWISADFHVHGPNSVDSGLDHETRVRSYLAEGVEYLSSSDHDYLTDYAPTIFRLHAQSFIKSQVGVECSPLDYGHFLGFPLRFDETADLNGAFHWRKDFPGGTPDWKNRPPGEIFRLLRERGEIDEAMVVVAHFYDHFDFYNIDAFTLEPPAFNLMGFFSPALMPNNFSGAFDGLEALSGKNLDMVRRPTYAEIRDYNRKLSELTARKDLPYEEIQRRWAQISSSAQREFMHRTVAEQKLALAYDNPDFACSCMSDADCGAKSLCDVATASCISSCDVDGDCDADRVAAGREACLPLAADLTRRTCQRLKKRCTDDTECTDRWGTEPTDPQQERCLQDGNTEACQFPCEDDAGCNADPLRNHCNAQLGICVLATPKVAVDEAPCTTMRGTLDDWFQMLNRGVRRTLFGNSDSHDTYGTEAGIPRNYIRSSTDHPPAIDKREVTRELRAMRSFATYGPFVELSSANTDTGGVATVNDEGKVQLSIRVQSPSWFDVDRLELYRNGELIKIVKGRQDCPQRSPDCIRLPNDSIVNYQAILDDKPSRDAWYVVVAMGIDGKSMAPVYSSPPTARLGLFEVIQRLAPLLPPLRSLGVPLSPTVSKVRPFAVTNPLFVDTDGDGAYTAPLPAPSWAKEVEASSSDSKTSGLAAPKHDHRVGIGKMRSGAKPLLEAMAQGKITKNHLKAALRSLRAMGRSAR
ncbi:MAG: hypothetical protein JRH20_05870 [Deltaproteobacteria bacterium]|nr:hypothetical protein [Deltaproteobacteria bacterium]